MKIEILLVEDINERCKGMTCFEAPEWLNTAIRHQPSIKGVIIIDGVASKFYYSPMGCDGDIFTSDDTHRGIIKHLIPFYVLSLSNK
jgi:hypothetical protein